jgi:cell division protein FtsB
MPRTTQRSPGAVRRLLGGDLPLVGLLIGAIVAGGMLLIPAFESYVVARGRVTLLEQQAALLSAGNQELEGRLADLDDPLNIELIAREQQGFIRPGEVPYVLVPPATERPRIVQAPVELRSDEDLLDRILAWLRRNAG